MPIKIISMPTLREQSNQLAQGPRCEAPKDQPQHTQDLCVWFAIAGALMAVGNILMLIAWVVT